MFWAANEKGKMWWMVKVVTIWRWEGVMNQEQKWERGWRNQPGSWFHEVRWCISKWAICNIFKVVRVGGRAWMSRLETGHNRWEGWIVLRSSRVSILWLLLRSVSLLHIMRREKMFQRCTHACVIWRHAIQFWWRDARGKGHTGSSRSHSPPVDLCRNDTRRTELLLFRNIHS